MAISTNPIGGETARHLIIGSGQKRSYHEAIFLILKKVDTGKKKLRQIQDVSLLEKYRQGTVSNITRILTKLNQQNVRSTGNETSGKISPNDIFSLDVLISEDPHRIHPDAIEKWIKIYGTYSSTIQESIYISKGDVIHEIDTKLSENEEEDKKKHTFSRKKPSDLLQHQKEYLFFCGELKKQILSHDEMCDMIIYRKVEGLHTNKEIVALICEEFSYELEIISPDITTRFQGTLYTVIEMVVKELIEEGMYNEIKSLIYSRTAKAHVPKERLAKMVKASRERAGVFNWETEHISLIKKLCKKHKRAGGIQIDRQKVVEVFQKQYPAGSANYIKRLIDKHVLTKKRSHHRKSHPEYISFLEEKLRSITPQNKEKYLLPYGEGYRLNSKVIIHAFNQQFPKSGVQKKSIIDKLGKLAKGFGLEWSEM